MKVLHLLKRHSSTYTVTDDRIKATLVEEKPFKVLILEYAEDLVTVLS